MSEPGALDPIGEIGAIEDQLEIELTAGLDFARQALTDRLDDFIGSPTPKKGDLIGQATSEYSHEFLGFAGQFITPELIRSGETDQVNNVMVSLLTSEDAIRVKAWNELLERHDSDPANRLSTITGLQFRWQCDDDADAGAAMLCEYVANLNLQAVNKDIAQLLDRPAVDKRIAKRERQKALAIEAGRAVLIAGLVVTAQRWLGPKKQV